MNQIDNIRALAVNLQDEAWNDGKSGVARASERTVAAFDALRAAIEQALGPGEVVSYQYRMRPTWGNKESPWGPWEECSKEKHRDCKNTPLWQYETREIYTYTTPPPQPQPKQEHDLKDVRCECCGYMTYHREHMGCIRAAAPPPQPDDTALLRQALEALRQCQFTTPPAQRKIVNAAIAAIRERLK